MSVASGPLSSGYSQDAIYESPLDYYHASANNSANGAPAELNAEMNSYIPDASQDQSNLMINYIPAGLMEEEMERLFENYGTIEQVKIVRDKMTNVSLCFGFVKYTNNEDAYKAALALNGLPLEGKRMKVSIAKPIGEREPKQYYRMPNTGSYQQQFPQYMQPQGYQQFPQYPPQAYPQYQQQPYAQPYGQQQQQPYFERKSLPLGLYVFNIPASATEPAMMEMFSAFGRVTSVKLITDQSGMCRGFGFVNMGSEPESVAAIQGLNGYEWGGKSLKVQFQNPKQPKQ